MSILTLQDSPQPIVSPASLAARREIAMALLKEGGNYSPIQSPWQGVARVADAFMGGLAARRLDQQELAGRQAVANDIGNAIQGAFGGGSSAFPPAPSSTPSDATINAAPSAAADQPTPSLASGDPMGQYANAIASIESAGSGGYSALGPETKHGDRAYGRYQVMGANIPQWTQEALGRPMTPQQFLADPKAQDAVFANRFGQYVKQYGNPQDAASAWFTGGPLSSGGGKSDVLGTTGNAYVDKFNRALGSPAAAAANAVASGAMPQAAPTQVASLDPSAGMAATGPSAAVPPEFASKGITQDQWNAMNAPDGAQPAKVAGSPLDDYTASGIYDPAKQFRGNPNAPKSVDPLVYSDPNNMPDPLIESLKWLTGSGAPQSLPPDRPMPSGPLPGYHPVSQAGTPVQVASLDPRSGIDIYKPQPLPAPYDSIRQAIPAPSQADISAAVSRVASGTPQQFPPEFSPKDISGANADLPQSAPIPQPSPLAGGPNGATPISPLGQRLLMDPHALSGDGGVLPPGAPAPTGKDAVVAAMSAPATASQASPAPSNLPVMAGGSADAVNPSLGAVGGGRGGMDPGAIAKIVNAMSSPWASEGQQQILGSVLSSRLTPHKIEMVPLGNGDTAEIDSITGQQVGMIHGVKPPIAMGYDQVLRDPNTGKIVGGGMDNGQLPYRFMTQQEKQANGLPLDTPIQIGPDGKMVSNGVTVNTGTPQSQYSDEMAKGLSGPHLALENGVEAAQEQQRDIHAMQGALQQIQQNGGTTGMGQPEIMKLQSAINTGANALGMDQPFDISDKEFLTKFNRQIAGAQAKSAAGARVTNFELRNYLAANPGLEMSPQGNERLLGIQNQILQRNIDLGQALRDKTAQAVSQGRKVNPAENEQLIRDYDAQHHIVDPITGQDLTKDVKLKDLQKPGTTSGTNNAVPAKPAPPIGAVEGGYRFKGGDPSSPDSWEKVQ